MGKTEVIMAASAENNASNCQRTVFDRRNAQGPWWELESAELSFCARKLMSHNNDEYPLMTLVVLCGELAIACRPVGPLFR